MSSLSFRADGQPWLASGDLVGEVLIWDLEKRRMRGAVREAHNGAPVAHLHFLVNEPVLVSSSADNSLKMWIWDGHENAEARLLRFRCGHSAPPCCIQYAPRGPLSPPTPLDRACLTGPCSLTACMHYCKEWCVHYCKQ